MKTINIIIDDTLFGGQISQYVADTLKLKYIDLHSLLPVNGASILHLLSNIKKERWRKFSSVAKCVGYTCAI